MAIHVPNLFWWNVVVVVVVSLASQLLALSCRRSSGW